MNIYHLYQPKSSSLYSDHLFLTGFILDPFRNITDDELWHVWYLTVLYDIKIIISVYYT